MAQLHLRRAVSEEEAGEAVVVQMRQTQAARVARAAPVVVAQVVALTVELRRQAVGRLAAAAAAVLERQ